MIRVQREDFDVQSEYQALLQADSSERFNTGAATMFVGLVRDFGDSKAFELKHYPGMTEKVLERIETEARKRWQLLSVRIIHRVGPLSPADQIVFVGVSSRHRADAFAACEYLIDLLKNQAPFWKKEGEHWVEAKQSDAQRALRWMDSR
ncbi:molybdenum cofactor biosynthesis protein MoaE [Agaribacterium haliotis]|uniref:molybdenum cofactor biosynthesis protein MoaE n=1 Tax=Agaribacterium haliotis TaxID=2013869 RepID=UPI000BB57AB3|nr:molybdenum cofactor biosynthesis protein MoaE [Agaribacterium haliotis]